ncbi:MAG TPA: hypothetical protein VF024_09040 [Solirubrobacteraceae bacterium]
MPHLRTLLLTGAVAVAALAPGAAAQAATVLSSEPVPTHVAAWNGTVMWSQLDQATGNYRLVKSVDGGAPAPVAVPERSGGPFDIDLGTNRSGSTYAVYTRDGDIYRLGVATGVETKITKLSSPTLAERDPAIQRGEIAFIRRDGGYDQLRIGDTTGGSKGSRFLVKKRSIAGAELAIKQVAYVEQSGASLLVHVRNISTGHDEAVYRATSGGANEAGVTRPTYDDATNAFVWARTNLGSGAGNRIVRYTLPGSKLGYAQGSPRYNSTAWAGPQLGAATASSLEAGDSAGACDDAGVHYCYVTVTGPLSFTLKP